MLQSLKQGLTTGSAAALLSRWHRGWTLLWAARPAGLRPPRQILRLWVPGEPPQWLQWPEGCLLAQEDNDTRPVQAGQGLWLPESCLLSQCREMPWASRADTQAMIRVMVEAASPFAPEDQVWAWTRLPTLPDAPRQRILWVLTSRRDIAEQLARLPSVPETDTLEIWTRVQGQWLLLPGYGEAPRLDRLRRHRLIQLGLLALTALLLALCIASPVLQKRMELIQLNTQMAHWQQQAAPALQAREALQRGVAQAQSLEQVRADALDVVEILDLITAVVPEDGWLDRMDIRGGRVVISGRVNNAAALQQTLNSLPRFAHVRAISPIAREPRSGKERFAFEMELLP
ncbi:general secretion pathway protein L [Ectothiorhodospira magna]|uniref:General secretion pathway protein L n=1 Tax=Ectothiorhodospira magna TaxID=867345 RepID=A0A1H9BIR9_9GAMM|nr:PilN domain-containing protein [Ectothiorhodospira magna]SEP88866.1 general secretion pathway protein L [Ectothiorhodospira magna]